MSQPFLITANGIELPVGPGKDLLITLSGGGKFKLEGGSFTVYRIFILGFYKGKIPDAYISPASLPYLDIQVNTRYAYHPIVPGCGW